MELSKKEIAEVSNAMTSAAKDQVQALDDLQLALVGGGYGETIL